MICINKYLFLDFIKILFDNYLYKYFIDLQDNIIKIIKDLWIRYFMLLKYIFYKKLKVKYF